MPTATHTDALLDLSTDDVTVDITDDTGDTGDQGQQHHVEHAPSELPARRTWRRALLGTVGLVRGAGWLVVLVVGGLLLVPSLFGLDRYVITGGSMEPTVDRGSVIFSEEVPVADLVVGDVITYQPPADSGISRLVTHRIVEVETGENGAPVFRTRGDANDTDDPWTFQLAEDRQNVMRYSVPLVGHALIALSNPEVRQYVIGIPAAFLAVSAALELLGISIRRRPGAVPSS